MIHIDKQSAPLAFTDFVIKQSPDNWQDFIMLDTDRQVYNSCMTCLRAEQGDISAYTEAPLGKGLVHIDHYRRRHLFPNLTFIWDNLLADHRTPNYGANLKDSIIQSPEQYDSLISPIVDNPTHFFTYQLNGDIIPCRDLSVIDRERAEFTIHCFGLQHPSLREQRRLIIKYIGQYIHSGLDAQCIREVLVNSGFPTVIDFALDYYENA